MKQKLDAFFKGMKHPKQRLFSLFFFAAYCISFYLIERRTSGFHMIDSPLDDKIPFLPGFILAYYFWFLYVFITLFWFFFVSEEDYLKGFWFLAIGMASFIILNIFWPTAIDIRPENVPGKDFCSWLVRLMYSIDTPTDVFPSLHVYNTVGIHACILNSTWIRKKAAAHSKDEKQYHRILHRVYTISAIIAVLIIISTMFVKQHSVIDVLGGLILGAIVYYFMYMFPKSPFKAKHA